MKPASAHTGKRHTVGRAATAVAGATVTAGAAYVLVASGALTLDLGVGRRTRALGPLRASIAAPPETVFDVIAGPYLSRTPKAMESKLRVLERGADLVLAAHHTPLAAGLVATTVETVRFERPHRIDFRLVRGPVPHVVETFDLRPVGDGTEFVYSGELGTDLWGAGSWWGDRVAGKWERAVEQSIASVKAESERRSRAASAIRS
jgi:polyketide cyclase/dehydrase/lipid transport protein